MKCRRCNHPAVKGYQYCDHHMSQVRREMVTSGYLQRIGRWDHEEECTVRVGDIVRMERP